MTEQQLIENLDNIGINPTEKQLNQLNKYYEMLVEWNKKMNLTGITVKNDVYLKHFYDSATLNKAIDLIEAENLCDIGTGAGFPGVVLKILFPNLKVTLLDSLNKRIIFLNEVIKELNLKDIEAVNERAENYCLERKNKFDIVTSRAVASLSILLEYSSPLTKINGHIVPMKAELIDKKEDIERICKELKISYISQKEFYLPIENSKRTLLIFQKKEVTPSKYPRKYAEMKKKPL